MFTSHISIRICWFLTFTFILRDWCDVLFCAMMNALVFCLSLQVIRGNSIIMLEALERVWGWCPLSFPAFLFFSKYEKKRISHVCLQQRLNIKAEILDCVKTILFYKHLCLCFPMSVEICVHNSYIFVNKWTTVWSIQSIFIIHFSLHVHMHLADSFIQSYLQCMQAIFCIINIWFNIQIISTFSSSW